MLNRSLLYAFSLLVFLSAGSTICDPNPWADNVCNQTIPIKKDIVIEQPVQYEIKVQSMCGLVPCTKTRIETRTDHSIRTITHQLVKTVCCSGYAETAHKRCAPICQQSCNNGGKCIAPETCKCQPEPVGSMPGFAGPTCSRFVCVEVDKWGSKCDKDCNCSGNSYCSADTGKCNCYPGWYGANCTVACNPLSDDVLECQESNKLPPIMEPESNLMTSQNLVLERHRSEPLVLNDEIKSDEAQDPRVHTSSYLIALLSIICLISIVSFLIIKRKYEKIRAELYGAPAAYATSTYSDPSNYNITTEEPSANNSGVSYGNLGKNFSFAVATRNILLGKDINASHKNKDEQRNKMILHPRVESHLIQSQKEAEQNLYTDIVLSMNNDHQKAQLPSNPPQYLLVDDHVYQIPKSSASSIGTMTDLSDLSANESASHNVTIEEDSISNIYEELKPQK